MPSTKILKLYEKYKGVCQSCGILTSFDDIIRERNVFRLGNTHPTIEHIVPKVLLGPTERNLRRNLTLFCYKCNNGGSGRISLIGKLLEERKVPLYKLLDMTFDAVAVLAKDLQLSKPAKQELFRIIADAQVVLRGKAHGSKNKRANG